MIAFERIRGRTTDACLSDLALDQLCTGEASGTSLEQSRRAHLAQCPTCAGRFHEIETAASAFLARPPSLGRVVADLRARQRRRWVSAAAALLGAGAAAAVCLAVRPTPPPATGERLKGAEVGLTMYVKRRGGTVETLLNGGRAEPGDRLRFVVTARRDGFVGVVSIDGTGTVTGYAPPEGRLVLARAGQMLPLAGAVELDGALGRERLVVFACTEPLDRAALVEDVRALVQEGRARLDGPLDVGRECVQSSTWFDKVGRR